MFGVAASNCPSARPLADERAEAIDAALATHDGNVSAAARQLGVHRSTIHRHLARSTEGCGTAL